MDIFNKVKADVKNEKLQELNMPKIKKSTVKNSFSNQNPNLKFLVNRS